MQNHFGAVRSEERYSVDADLLREIRQVSRNFSTSDLQLLCRHSQHVFSELKLGPRLKKNTKKENIKVTFESSDTKLQQAERLSWC